MKMKPIYRNFSLLLTEPEAAYLDREARQNCRSRGAELRRLLRSKMEGESQPAGPISPFGWGDK